MVNLTPKAIVQELDRYIIGQSEAKRAVAVALCNRERRKKLSPELRSSVMPKNILLVGPTGVGKTELARHLAAIINAPFLKVEATKFTEVGYVGRDVESIPHDLVEVSATNIYQEKLKEVETRAEKLATEKLVNYLCRQLTQKSKQLAVKTNQLSSGVSKTTKSNRPTAIMRRRVTELLSTNQLEEQLIEIDVGDDTVEPLCLK